jgi:phosphoribulokinase
MPRKLATLTGGLWREIGPQKKSMLQYIGEGATTTMALMKIVSNSLEVVISLVSKNSPHKLLQPNLEVAISKNKKPILANAFGAFTIASL